jgi:outer membrane protein OmpA-like peptidoglycan-associated protein
MGGAVKFIGQTFQPPFNIKLGGSAHVMDGGTLLCADLNLPSDDFLFLGAGAEYNVNEYAVIRAGFTTEHYRWLNLSFGAGIRIRSWVVDYSVASKGNFGLVHAVSVWSRFGELPAVVVREDSEEEIDARTAGEQYEVYVVSGTVFGPDPGSSELEREEYGTLRIIAEKLRSSAVHTGEITGYADDAGNPSLNGALALSRAKSVLSWLANNERISERNFTLSGSTNTASALPVQKKELWNRRVEIRIRPY